MREHVIVSTLTGSILSCPMEKWRAERLLERGPWMDVPVEHLRIVEVETRIVDNDTWSARYEADQMRLVSLKELLSA